MFKNLYFILIIVFSLSVFKIHSSEDIRYRTSSKKHSSQSKYTFALMLYRGEGVEQNLEKAFLWFKSAAEQGYAPAQYSLAMMYRKGRGVEQDFVSAYVWMKVASLIDRIFINDKNSFSIFLTPDQLEEADQRAQDIVDEIVQRKRVSD